MMSNGTFKQAKYMTIRDQVMGRLQILSGYKRNYSIAKENPSWKDDF